MISSSIGKNHDFSHIQRQDHLNSEFTPSFTPFQTKRKEDSSFNPEEMAQKCIAKVVGLEDKAIRRIIDAEMSEEKTVCTIEQQFNAYEAAVTGSAGEKPYLTDSPVFAMDIYQYISNLEHSLSVEHGLEVQFQPDLTLTALEHIISQGILPDILKFAARETSHLRQEPQETLLRPQDYITQAFKNYRESKK